MSVVSLNMGFQSNGLNLEVAVHIKAKGLLVFLDLNFMSSHLFIICWTISQNENPLLEGALI